MVVVVVIGHVTEFDANAFDLLQKLAQFLGWTVVLACGWVIRRAVRAKFKVSTSYGDHVDKTRNRVRRAELRPALGRLFAVAYSGVQLNKRTTYKTPADREQLAVRMAAEFEGSFPTYSDAIDEIEEAGVHLRDCNLLQVGLVECRRHQAFAAGILLVLWVYILAWAYTAAREWPTTVMGVVLMLCGACIGWLAAEAWRENRISDEFSDLRNTIAKVQMGDES